MGDQLQTEAVRGCADLIIFLILTVKSFSRQYHPFSLVLKYRESVRLQLMWGKSWASQGRRLSFLACNLLWPRLVLSLKLEIELNGIHRSLKFYSAGHKVFWNKSLSVECYFVLLHYCKGPVGFALKSRIRFILIKTHKKSYFYRMPWQACTI